nr:reverse transcriptase domain-containing protein [Tanacetum cinerariifolium]
MFGQFMKMNTASSSGSRTLPSNTITNLKEDLKGIITRSGNAYQGPTIPTTSSSLPKVVKCETEVTKDTVPPTNNRSTKDVQPLVVQIEAPVPNFEPVVAPVAEPVTTLVSVLKPNQKPSIPYPSRLHDRKLHDKTNDRKEKFSQIFKDLDFNISFADALILIPKFGPTIRVELKDLPPHLKYAFLEGDDKFLVIIAKYLSVEEKAALIKVLKSHKQAISWKLSDIKGWRISIDYRKLNEATLKNHFPLPFMDQMLERLAGNEYYCFLDGFSGYFQIPIDPKDQEKTTFMCLYGLFSYRRMPFGLCNPPGTFQRCGLEATKNKAFLIDTYASKTMTDSQAHYTTTEKELLAVVYAFEKFRPYLLLSKSIMYTDHSALNICLTSKMPNQNFSVGFSSYKNLISSSVIKKAENLAADHLSRLENPLQSVLDKKEINETFPLETLNMSSDGVFTAMKPLTFSRLTTMDPPGDTMA